MKPSIIIFILLVVAAGVFALVKDYQVLPSTPLANLGVETYSSEHLDLSFKYPSSYSVESQHAGTAERQWHVLVFLPKGYIAPEGGEGPATITISVYDNPERTPLETWVRGDARSNFKLSADGGLTPAVVGGESGLSYRHSGLYETDATAVAHDDKIYVFAAGWQSPEEKTRAQLKDLLSTVQFL